MVEAKRTSINAADAAGQGAAYTKLLGVPLFLANGTESQVLGLMGTESQATLLQDERA